MIENQNYGLFVFHFVLCFTVSSVNLRRPQLGMLGIAPRDSLSPVIKGFSFELTAHKFDHIVLRKIIQACYSLKWGSVLPSHLNNA
ncbi:MAG: hypothetical protein ACI808_001560 [Paraglaciecola sp.]|jgi:hypothetical protein